MKKELNNEVMENEVVETVEATQEEPKEKFISKVGKGIKKHGKKALVGAGVAGVTLLAYALGKKSAKGYSDVDMDDESNIIDIEDYSAEEAE